MFCEYCGIKMINEGCNNCLNNSKSLREFEKEND